MAIQYVDENADLVGTVAETFNCSSSNDQLEITIDGGTLQTITLGHGSARTAAQVAADINASLVDGTAYAIASGPQANHVRIRTTSEAAASSTILIGAPSNNCNTLLGFTATTYTGYTRGHTSWAQSAGTKQELIDKIESELNAVGWTTVSGSGTTTLVMQSALSPPGQNLQMVARIKGTNTNCVSISIENVAGTKASTNSTTAGFMLLPAASKTWLFTINKYQAFIRTPVTTAVREFAAFGIPALPIFLQGVVTEAIWGHGNSWTDTDATLRDSFRTRIEGSVASGPGAGNFAGICNNNLMQSNNTAGIFAGALRLTPTSNTVNAINSYTWHDASALLLDALIGWGLTAASDAAKWRGLLWDAVVSSEAYTGDLTTSFDSHNWIVLTDNNTGLGSGTLGTSQNTQRGSLLLTTP